MAVADDGFEDPWPGAGSGAGSTFIVDLAGFEGPLDALLTLARRQKVDLARISILELADQYLAFVAQARDIRLDLAADYLVMAAWLAYLKSRLLLPVAAEEPSPERMAEALQFHLERLAALRDAAGRLMRRPRLGTDLFRCGNAEGLGVDIEISWSASLFDLLDAYADRTFRREHRDYRPPATELMGMEEALIRLRDLVGELPRWSDMLALLPEAVKGGLVYRAAVGSTLAASLELARLGEVELRQSGPFAPIELRSGNRGGRR